MLGFEVIAKLMFLNGPLHRREAQTVGNSQLHEHSNMLAINANLSQRHAALILPVRLQSRLQRNLDNNDEGKEH